MEIRVSVVGESARVSLGGRFDFSAHRQFRDITEELLARDGVAAVDLDFGAVSYLDSSALGMLLMLRDKARNAQREIRLSNLSLPVQQVLAIANFQKLFRIE